MLGLGKPKPVAEHEADGEIDRVYHEIRQVLRVSGVNLNFRTWAAFDKFFPVMWDAMRPNAETRTFENAADAVRGDAGSAARSIGRVDAISRAAPGESQAFQIRAALRLYHYINPKLLIFTSAVRMALAEDNHGGRSQSEPELIERGVPSRMYPMAMVDEKPEEKRIQKLFDNIKSTLSLSSINSDYRTLALWPEYLEQAWHQLRPLVQTAEYRAAADRMREQSRKLAASLPLEIALSGERVRALGEDLDDIERTTENFERILPPLILNIALLAIESETDASLIASPYPAQTRGHR